MGSDLVTVVANSVTATTNPSSWEFMIQILPYKKLPFMGFDNPHGIVESN